MTIIRLLYNRRAITFYGVVLLGLAFLIPFIIPSNDYFSNLQITFTISAAFIAFLVFLDSVNEKRNLVWKSEKNFIESLHKEITLNLALINSLGEFNGGLENSPLDFYNPTRAIFPLNIDVLVYSITKGEGYFIDKKDLLLKLIILNNDISKFNIQTKELHDFRFSNLELLGQAMAYLRDKNLIFDNIISDLKKQDDVLREWFFELRLRNWAIASQFATKIRASLEDIRCELEKYLDDLLKRQPLYQI